MTYNASVPVAGSSPGLFPSQANANFARLQTLLGADHQFNNSAAANDGYHKLVHMDIPNPLPTGALPLTGRLYARTVSGNVQLFYMDSAGVEYQITPQSGSSVVVAAVNFNGISGASIRGTAVNVSSVVRNSTGTYTINFATPIASNNYIVQVTGMRDGLNDISNGQVAGSGTYGSSVSTTFLRVQFNGGTSSLQDVLMGNVIVYLPS